MPSICRSVRRRGARRAGRHVGAAGYEFARVVPLRWGWGWGWPYYRLRPRRVDLGSCFYLDGNRACIGRRRSEQRTRAPRGRREMDSRRRRPGEQVAEHLGADSATSASGGAGDRIDDRTQRLESLSP